ncbi:MAG: class I SAM-dependent methyltransferase [Candidatus Methanoperedens sp.]|nr:class I SAM-dependent methyltransferase [Candidatus Methanoperedens sp.]MCZ7371191.1 class I SAM-dependent methyltransferase [Candidatus Methanoperedens sp.]
MLDVGCGTKPYRKVFVDVVKEHIGIDYPSSISANKENKNVEIYSILPHLPFKNETFDTVLATEVLEHVSEPSAAFSEINRILKKNGVLILTAPQCWGLHETPQDYYRYTKFGLKYLSEKNSFEVIYIKPLGGFFSLIGQRLSSFIFYLLAIDEKGNLRNILLRGLAHVICMFLQLIFTITDRIFYEENDTLGNIMVARKIIS